MPSGDFGTLDRPNLYLSNMKNNNFKGGQAFGYVAPQLELVSVEVEQGFAESFNNGELTETNPIPGWE